MRKGFTRLYQLLPDLALDAPNAASYLAGMVTQVGWEGGEDFLPPAGFPNPHISPLPRSLPPPFSQAKADGCLPSDFSPEELSQLAGNSKSSSSTAPTTNGNSASS